MSEDSKISKAQQKAVNKYVKNNYDRINVTFPKGHKDILKKHAAQYEESVNAFIVRSVIETMERDTEGIAQPQAATEPLLPPDTLKEAQNAAERTGEAVPEFVTRAVKTQAKRDETTRRMGLDPITGDKFQPRT